ncbi:zinc metalloprotease [Aquimarina mytili]|uniref:Dual-action HEIGH metallo-peptidase n=1 Tax=Aquimarina mytili TaxID=874423 RepID=A0A937A1H0_9FLAO|nr:M57 family metalloprotease [Aquimarina mytili]MBL0685740.1 hypothetical protein [Aquimarina mytili]
MKTFNLFLYAFLSLIILSGCEKNEIETIENQELQKSKTIQKLLEIGFSNDEIIDNGKYFLVQDDVVYPYDWAKELNETSGKQRFNGIPISPNNTVIGIYLAQETFHTLSLRRALEEVIWYHNRLNNRTKFYLSGLGPVVISADNSIFPGFCAQASAPRIVNGEGVPGGFININEDYMVERDYTSNDELKLILAHELGHIVGLNHTNQSFGQLIPGTPQSDPGSIMISNNCGVNWNGYTNFDKLALETIYTLPPPEIKRAGPGCSDKLCIWMVGKFFQHDKSIVEVKVPTGQIYRYNISDLVYNIDFQGQEVITLRLKTNNERNQFGRLGYVDVRIINPDNGDQSSFKRVRR